MTINLTAFKSKSAFFSASACDADLWRGNFFTDLVATYGNTSIQITDLTGVVVESKKRVSILIVKQFVCSCRTQKGYTPCQTIHIFHKLRPENYHFIELVLFNHPIKKYRSLLFLLITALYSAIAPAQVQIGNDIDGEAAGDWSGYSVSMPNANTVAIGATGNDGNGTFAGHVRIYAWNGASWLQKGADIDGEAAGDNSGYSVSMPDANTVAIGAPRNDGNGGSAGHVRIYAWNGSSWQQKGVDIDGEAANNWSGVSVSMPDAHTVAIGASGNDGNGSNAGHVRIYAWNGTSWQQKGADIDGEASSDWSGESVSMPDANTVAIGAPKNDGNGTHAGHVRIYVWNGSSWQKKGTDIDGEAVDDESGWSVSMPDANTVAIGASSNGGNGYNAGQVRIYAWNGSSWQQKGADIDGEAAYDESGGSVSMPDANTVAIGARGNEGNGNGGGHVRIYAYNGTSWLQKGTDIDGEAVGDWSGFSVSMPDAHTVAIGALFNDGNGTDAGQVRIYSLCDSGTTSILTVSTCDSLNSPSGRYTWYSSGTYQDTLTNAAGCDSIVTLNLTINAVSDTSLTTSGATVTANNSSAAYQWLDCGNNYAPIPGETNQSFTPTANGNYAVELTENGCIDTSACVAITNVGIVENSIEDRLIIYPNPTRGEVVVSFTKLMNNVTLTLTNLQGKVLMERVYQVFQTEQIELNGAKGIYFLTISSPQGRSTVKLVKN